MNRIRLTQRRDALTAARRRAAATVQDAIYPMMNRQHRALERFLRRGGNLKKRIVKVEYMAPVVLTDGMSNVGNAVYQKVNGLLFKQEQDHQEWDTWKKLLVAALILALLKSIGDLGDVENGVWESRGFTPVTFDPQQIIDDYQLRTGRNLSDIGDTTLSGVQQTITDWYIADQPFGDLTTRLDRWFSQQRARTIALTEVSNSVAQMVVQEMTVHGWREWYWDAMGEDPCTNHPITLINFTYNGCRELNGRRFPLGTPMPPDASHPACECLPTPVVE